MAGRCINAPRALDPEASMAAAANRFGKFKPEEEHAVRRVESAGNSHAIGKLLHAYEANRTVYRFGYDEACRLVRRLDYSADDVAAFLLGLPDYRDEEFFDVRAGTFISALINCGKGSEYALNLAHLPPISRLGWQNTKNISICGDVKGELGAHMECGRIGLTGNAGHHTGTDMKGGEIVIHGDVVDHIKGIGLHGMSFDQRTLLPVGINMTGGEIHVFGDLDVEDSRESIESGRLFHNRTLVVDK